MLVKRLLAERSHEITIALLLNKVKLLGNKLCGLMQRVVDDSG